ncbi:DNA translocase FtsK-like [Helicoverpa armigera]|uniref:DNA translocase FtsK-like n=1 Tax=Helicoverpa armigera TaxID=29058 RepID=UPI0030839050
MASDEEAVNITEKRLIVEVLELYKDFPCLWDSSHDLYCNKDARSQAWEIILQNGKRVTHVPPQRTSRKKIEHLRAAYRRERNKVEASKSTGAGSKDVHTPSLWYYPYLTFLHEKTIPISEGIDRQEPVTKKEKPTNKQLNSLYKKQEELIQSATQLIKESSSHEDTSADAFGRSVSFQLKELPKLQRYIAEKMIGELLFYAKLEELFLDTSINLNKNIHTGTQSYDTQPHSSHLYQQHSLPSSSCLQYSQPSPSPQYPQPSPSPQYPQPSPSPQYSQPSPSQYSQTSQSPKYSQRSQSPKHSQTSPKPLSSSHYLQHSSSLCQQSTPSLPRTPADTITIHSADPHSQSLSPVLLPNDIQEFLIFKN